MNSLRDLYGGLINLTASMISSISKNIKFSVFYLPNEHYTLTIVFSSIFSVFLRCSLRLACLVLGQFIQKNNKLLTVTTETCVWIEYAKC